MKKMTMIMATIGASLLTLIATAISAGACYWGGHQPVEPDSLSK